MNTSDKLIVKRAGCAFRAGQYNTALSLYEEAAQCLGAAFFEVNIRLCEQRRQAESGSDNPALNARVFELEDQLQQTQQLLEHYFNRSQALEHQLLDQ